MNDNETIFNRDYKSGLEKSLKSLTDVVSGLHDAFITYIILQASDDYAGFAGI